MQPFIQCGGAGPAFALEVLEEPGAPFSESCEESPCGEEFRNREGRRLHREDVPGGRALRPPFRKPPL